MNSVQKAYKVFDKSNNDLEKFKKSLVKCSDKLNKIVNKETDHESVRAIIEVRKAIDYLLAILNGERM